MSAPETSLAPVPAEIDRMAHYAYPSQSAYLLVGDRLDDLLDGIDLDDLEEGAPLPAPPHVLALLTIFQHAEGLSDNETIRALYGRLDWRYALHLPLRFERIKPMALRKFRTCVRRNKPAQESIKSLMHRLEAVAAPLRCDWDPAHR